MLARTCRSNAMHWGGGNLASKILPTLNPKSFSKSFLCQLHESFDIQKQFAVHAHFQFILCRIICVGYKLLKQVSLCHKKTVNRQFLRRRLFRSIAQFTRHLIGGVYCVIEDDGNGQNHISV